MIKLASINIELDKHLDLVENFLKEEQPDVACLQEIYETDLQNLATKLGMTPLFGQMALMGRFPFGIGILSRVPFESVSRAYYFGDKETAPTHTYNGEPQSFYRLLLSASFQKEGTNAVIGTTHFTWTPNGETDQTQKAHFASLLEVLQGIPEIVFCGDLNAPRGREIFDTLATSYKDNIPQRYTTSIDKNIHRAGNLQLMVDGLFSTPAYTLKNVRLEQGVSDHLAIVAEISHSS